MRRQRGDGRGMRAGYGCFLGLMLSMPGCGTEPVTVRPEPERPPVPPIPTPYLAKLYFTGRVTDSSGQAVEGALVVVEVRPKTHRTECDWVSLSTGGKTDADGMYLNKWGENGWLGRGCVGVFASKGSLFGRRSLVDVILRSVTDALPPDTVVVDVVLDEGG